jgi:hypothetical protein
VNGDRPAAEKSLIRRARISRPLKQIGSVSGHDFSRAATAGN